MTKEEILKAMIEWQIDAGEDFLDYFEGNVKIPNLMCWALGRGHITVEQFNIWEQDDSSPSGWLTHTVHDCHGDNIPYAFVSEEEWTEEGQDKAYGILAEFISESTIYQERFKEFLE